MLRNALKLLFLGVMVVGGAAGLVHYERKHSVELKLRRAEERNDQLRQIVRRLHAERRVADIIVTEQKPGPDGQLRTTLLFVEYSRDGSTPLPGKRFTVEGKTAHIDAMVVKFEGRFVEENDPLRGGSIALFTRLYGDRQTPEQAHRIDEPGKIPAVYRGADPQVTQFEQALWADFWKLADDPSYRKEMGVRVVQGEGLWGPFEPGKLYTISVESNGGLNLVSEPLKQIYREALNQGGGIH